MEFQDVVRKRKMVRSFEQRPIPDEIVERIVANIQKAPSAGFSQGWGFLVLEGKDAALYWNELWPEERRTDWGWPDIFNAPLLIVCLSNKTAYLRRYAEPDKGWTDMDEKRWPVPYWDVDAGMAALLALLTAVDAGLGAIFFGVFDQAKLRTIFRLRTTSWNSISPFGRCRARVGVAPHRRDSGGAKRGRNGQPAGCD